MQVFLIWWNFVECGDGAAVEQWAALMISGTNGSVFACQEIFQRVKTCCFTLISLWKDQSFLFPIKRDFWNVIAPHYEGGFVFNRSTDEIDQLSLDVWHAELMNVSYFTCLCCCCTKVWIMNYFVMEIPTKDYIKWKWEKPEWAKELNKPNKCKCITL